MISIYLQAAILIFFHTVPKWDIYNKSSKMSLLISQTLL